MESNFYVYPIYQKEQRVITAYKTVLDLAMIDCGGGKVCEDFLLSWYNNQAWGNWAPHTINKLDRETANQVLLLLASVQSGTWYPESRDMDRLIKAKGRVPLGEWD